MNKQELLEVRANVSLGSEFDFDIITDEIGLSEGSLKVLVNRIRMRTWDLLDDYTPKNDEFHTRFVVEKDDKEYTYRMYTYEPELPTDSNIDEDSLIEDEYANKCICLEEEKIKSISELYYNLRLDFTDLGYIISDNYSGFVDYNISNSSMSIRDFISKRNSISTNGIDGSCMYWILKYLGKNGIKSILTQAFETSDAIIRLTFEIRCESIIKGSNTFSNGCEVSIYAEGYLKDMIYRNILLKKLHFGSKDELRNLYKTIEEEIEVIDEDHNISFGDEIDIL